MFPLFFLLFTLICMWYYVVFEVSLRISDWHWQKYPHAFLGRIQLEMFISSIMSQHFWMNDPT